MATEINLEISEIEVEVDQITNLKEEIDVSLEQINNLKEEIDVSLEQINNPKEEIDISNKINTPTNLKNV